MFRMVTPRMVQLVVIRGRYTPRDLYRAGTVSYTHLAVLLAELLCAEGYMDRK